jgi:hypothetical protein
MECSHSDNGDDCGPDPCVQSENLIGGTRSGLQTEAFVMHAYNIWHEEEDCQKKHDGKAVDEDNGKKSILERLIDDVGTPTLVAFGHEISLLLALHKNAGSLRSRVTPL